MNLQNNKLNIITSCYSNLNCSRCIIDNSIPVVETNFNKRKLHTIFDFFKNQGVRSASFMGGEPLMNSYLLLETMALASNYFQHISLLTNGILLDKYLLDRMIEIGLNTIKFSILSAKDEEYAKLAGLSRPVFAPKKMIAEASKRQNLEVILYFPIFDGKKEFENFNELLDELSINKLTFITTEEHQFQNIDFYRNISKTASLARKDDYLEIYDTNKYSIGFFDIISYIKTEDRFYLYPDMNVRTSISVEDSLFVI